VPCATRSSIRPGTYSSLSPARYRDLWPWSPALSAAVGCVLLEDACATSSPDYCKQAVVFNAKQCWGFSTTTAKFASPSPVQR
jgi:hypothetical protein